MSGPQVLVGDPTSRRRPGLGPDPDSAWRLLAWVGFALGVVAYGNMFLGVLPLAIGDPQWEFGTVSRLFDSLPLVTVATLLFFAGSVARGTTALVRVVGLWSLLLGVALVFGLVLYALTLPLALGAVTDVVAKAGLQKAIAKTLVQGVVYPATFIALGVYGLRKQGAAK